MGARPEMSEEPYVRSYKGFCAKSDGSRFDFAPKGRITRKGLTLLHQRLTEQDFDRQLEKVGA